MIHHCKRCDRSRRLKALRQYYAVALWAYFHGKSTYQITRPARRVA